MPKKPTKQIDTPGPERLTWDLDARESRFVFGAGKERAEELIHSTRQKLMELEQYDPLPQHYRDGAFSQYDNEGKAGIIVKLREWLAYYEKIHRFCIKADALIMHYEAEEFGKEMADMFKGRK